MTPQEEIQVRQMMANQMSARQPMFRAQMPDMDPTPRITASTPEAERDEYLRQRQALENAARFSGLLGNTPTPTPTTNYRPPYSREEIERLMRDEEAQRLAPPGFDPGTPLRPPETMEEARARARLEAERPFNPGSTTLYTPGPYAPPYTGGTPRPDGLSLALALSDPEEYDRRVAALYRAPVPEGQQRQQIAYLSAADRVQDEADRVQALARRAAMDGSPPYTPGPYAPPTNPLSPVGGGVAADPEPEEYDGFVDSGTGQRGYLDFKYMPTPMDTSVAMAQAAPPVANTAYNAPPVANTAYNAPPVASTAYMPPPTAAPVNTAYMPPPTDAPVNTAYMPSRRTVPVDTTYRPPASANTTYMPSPSPSYGMSTTPTYNMSTSTTPTYGTSNGGQMREPSYSPNQAGKYKVDGPRLRNTGGLFNDLNAFFGRPQT